MVLDINDVLVVFVVFVVVVRAAIFVFGAMMYLFLFPLECDRGACVS